jgi:hypothetical protein
MLRDKEEAWARRVGNELREMSRHGLLVMRNQHSPFLAAAAKTSGSFRPKRSAASAVRKSMAGSRRIVAKTIIWFRSASA